MTYTIDIFDDGGSGLGITWEVDTRDPDWRDQLPGPAEFAPVIDEHLGVAQSPTIEGAAMVLRRLGYDRHADLLDDLHTAETP
jgi:hypothetical protein